VRTLSPSEGRKTMIMHLTQENVKRKVKNMDWGRHGWTVLWLIGSALAILWAMAHYRG